MKNKITSLICVAILFTLLFNTSKVYGENSMDLTPPSTPVVFDSGAYTSSINSLYANWSASDNESNIVKYIYALGTSPFDRNVQNWTDAGNLTEINITGLSLTEGVTYYISVKATNSYNLTSETGTSDGILVDTTPPIIAIISPDDDAVYENNVALDFITSDSSNTHPVSGLAICNYTFDNESTKYINCSITSLNINISQLTDGRHALILTASDNSGNSNYDSISFVKNIDNTLSVCNSQNNSADFTDIATAVDEATDGDTISLCAGTFNENVLLNKYVNILGSGINKTEIISNTGRALEISSNNITIANITFKGTSNGQNGITRGIYLSNTTNITIDNSEFEGFEYGINFITSSKTIVKDSYFHNNTFGIYSLALNQATYNIINSSVFESNAYGIYTYKEENLSIINSTFTSQDNYSIYANNSYNITAYNNEITGGDIGIYFINTSASQILNNFLNNSLTRAISLESTSNSSNNLIQGNNINNTQQRVTGIYISDSLNKIYDNNIYCSNPRYYQKGIVLSGLTGFAENNKFMNNDISSCYFGFSADTINNFTVNNDSYQNNYYGIYLTAVSSNSNATKITNTTIKSNCEGARVRSRSVVSFDDVNFTNNSNAVSSFCTNEDTGIYVTGDSSAYVLNGNFINNGPYAIFDERPLSVSLTMSKNVECINNDMSFAGSVVWAGGELTQNNCSITVYGLNTNTVINITNETRGYKEYALKSEDGTNVLLGGKEDFFSAMLHLNSNDSNTLIVQYLNNINATGFSQSSLNKWLEASFENNTTSVDSWILKMYYTDEELARLGVSEDSLVIEYYNASNDSWEIFNAPRGGVNTSDNYVWANVTHFSTFGIFGSICGNGIVEPEESCDFGSSNGACPATCSSSCTVNSCAISGGSSTGGLGFKESSTQSCTNWSECINNKKTRECRYLNKKETQTEKCESSKKQSHKDNSHIKTEPEHKKTTPQKNLDRINSKDSKSKNKSSQSGNGITGAVTGSLNDDSLTWIILVGILFVFSAITAIEFRKK